MARIKQAPYLTPQDIHVLRGACQAQYELLNELMREHRIPLEARDVIERLSKEVHRVWSKLPDEGI